MAAKSDEPKPIITRAGIISESPMDEVYMRPFTFLRAQLSASGPPIITPINELIAIVIVAIGPATTIDMPSDEANSSGSQFFVDHPGMEHDAKKKSIVQNAALPRSMPSEDFTPARPWLMAREIEVFSLASAAATRFSYRNAMRITA